jgi:hypothetical protein
LYLGWTVAQLLSIQCSAPAWQVNKPIHDVGSLRTQRTLGSVYTQVDYCIFIQGISEDYRLPECDAVTHHNVTGKDGATSHKTQTFKVTAETTWNLARHLWVSSMSTWPRLSRKVQRLWNDIQLQLRPKSSVQ